MKEAEKILAKAKFANEQPAQEPVAGYMKMNYMTTILDDND